MGQMSSDSLGYDGLQPLVRQLDHLPLAMHYRRAERDKPAPRCRIFLPGITVARVSPAYGIDDDQLFRTTTDLPAAFQAMAGPSTYSTVYTAADKGGTTVSCEAAWAHIADKLSDPTLFDGYAAQVCTRTGFDVAQPDQLQRCKSQLGEMGQMMMARPLSAQTFLTHVLLGNSVGDVLFEDSPATAARVMANRAAVSSSLATLSVANEWMPTIRATVFGIMLFMVPIALMFILTPINLRVASFALGLFVFTALWGVIDAGIYQLTLGRAAAVLAEMRSNGVAANAWLLAPSSAIKALAVFGTFRTAAAGLAAAFVFTVFRFSGSIFDTVTGSAGGLQAQASSAAGGTLTSEGFASALEAQGSARGTATRARASASFGDFGDRSNFSASRSFGEAGTLGAATPSAGPGSALAFGGIDGARQLGGLAPALGGRDPSDPAVARAVQANAATGAIQDFAEKDALRTLGTGYFGAGQAGEKAFASFAQNMVQWRAFGDERAYGMMMQTAIRHFERGGYSKADAALKASGIIADASADPTFAKLTANAFDQDQMLRNDLTGAQIQVGAMQGRRDFAGVDVAPGERRNVATEQASRSGRTAGDRAAASMLGLSVEETSRRISFINALSGEARSSAVSQLARTTGRNEAQVERALERYSAATQLGTSDGASAEARRERTSVYGRTRDAAGYDFAERSGKLDAQRQIRHDGTRAAARIGEERQQAGNFGYAEGAEAAGTTTREAARLDSFIQTLSATAGNQVDIADGGPAGIADRGRNARTSRIVENERLSRMQGLLRANGVTLSRKQLAVDQNGDLALNLTPQAAGALHKAGLINDSQFGAIAEGGIARFSFADNDMLVSSSTGFERSARNDTSTRFEAGKQAGPDTIEHFLGGGKEGHAAMANWLQGGFEMDRQGHWRLKPQVADTLQRDVQAIMAQTGWQRSITRSAIDQNQMGTAIGGEISGSVASLVPGSARTGGTPKRPPSATGSASGQLSITSSDTGTTSEAANAQLDVVNYDVRNAIAAAERISASARDPASAFTDELSRQVLGDTGLRNRYLEQSDSARGVVDITGPMTSIEQNAVLDSGRLSTDLKNGPFDGESDFKRR